MPVINFGHQDLLGLLRRDLTVDELIQTIPMMGADLHDVNRDTGEIAMEFFPDRPDLFSVEGIARALRAFLGVESGIKLYPVSDSGMTITNEPGTKSVRPFVVAGVMRDVIMSDELIRSLMEMQEKLHLTIGRKRAKVSIGIHDLDMVTPPFFYRAVEPESISFVPLAKTEEMNLREVLERHEKGREYAFVLEGKSRYPVIVDRDGQVLSFPPIINGRLTTVTEETTSLFIDVTGTDLKAISGALNIVATSIAERGASIESVKVLGERDMVTPALKPEEWRLEGDFCRSFLGVDIGDEAICQCLARMGFDARLEGETIRVLAPAVRMDLLHPVDLIEDVAIGYGYQNFGHSLPRTQTFGRVRPVEHLSDLLRQLMVGYGYMEVTTLMLSCPHEQFDLLCLPPQEMVDIQNPITEDHTCVRLSLLPNMMAVLRRNKHRDLPQRIFEVGDVMVDLRRRRYLAGLSVHPKSSFTEMKSLVQSLLRDCSVEHTLEPHRSRMYIDGRAASVVLGDQGLGHFGELSPEAITNLGLDYPISAFELDVETMLLPHVGTVF